MQVYFAYCYFGLYIDIYSRVCVLFLFFTFRTTDPIQKRKYFFFVFLSFQDYEWLYY